MGAAPRRARSTEAGAPSGSTRPHLGRHNPQGTAAHPAVLLEGGLGARPGLTHAEQQGLQHTQVRKL